VSAPRVSVVIVSYDVCGLLRECLESVRRQRGVECETFVVDNASRDGSADMVEREFPEARLTRNPGNVGFARANNQALAQARGDCLLLLNPDTRLPDGALEALAGVFGRHPGAGAVGLALCNPDGSEQPSCFAFPGLWNQALEGVGLKRLALGWGGTPSAARAPAGGEGEVEWVSGACLALSRRAWEEVGGLDESLFMYGEEMDWCWRARRRGYPTVWSGAVTVLHHGGASGTGVRGPLFALVLRARIEFLRRHRGAVAAFLGRGILLAGALPRLAWWLVRRALERPLRPWTRDQVERYQWAVTSLAGLRR
jgi:N-acetylglucosaminyl-diphospho-decaprenol L-rhamnosyltransferase